MLYGFAHFVFRIIYRVFFRCQVHGAEHLPQQGPLIICANHVNWVDPAIIGSMLPLHYRIKFMAKEELFRNKFVSFLLKRAGAFPVNREKADFTAVRHSFKVLEGGGIIGLFPEGTRSKSGKLQNLQEGAALIAARSGAPVLPVVVTGSYSFGGPINVTIGAVFQLSATEFERKKKRKALLAEGNKKIYDNLKALYPADSDARF